MNRVMHLPSLETLYASSSALYNQASSQFNRSSTVAADCLHKASAWTCRSVETARCYFSQINVSRVSAMSATGRAYLSPSFDTARTALGKGTEKAYSCISHLLPKAAQPWVGYLQSALEPGSLYLKAAPS
jgi:hypothetical protein